MALYGSFLRNCYATASGILIDSKTNAALPNGNYRIHGFSWACTAVSSAAGPIRFRDGTTIAATPLITKHLPGAIWNDSEVPNGDGVRFFTNIYVELPTGATVSVYIDG